MTDPPLIVTTVDGIASLRLNRPSAGNALNGDMVQALADAAAAVAADAAVRCVVLSAAGRQFCVGGDLAAFRSMGADAPEIVEAQTAMLHRAIGDLVRMANWCAWPNRSSSWSTARRPARA